MMNDIVSSVMTKNVFTVRPEDSLGKVKELFENHRIHHVPVVDDTNQLVGIVTTYDLVKSDIKISDYENNLVKDYMTTKVATLNQDSMIGTACELFILNRFHALPIVEDNKLIGIITSHDVLNYSYKKAYPEEHQRIFG